jgi:hypothetical protein
MEGRYSLNRSDRPMPITFSELSSTIQTILSVPELHRFSSDISEVADSYRRSGIECLTFSPCPEESVHSNEAKIGQLLQITTQFNELYFSMFFMKVQGAGREKMTLTHPEVRSIPVPK